MSIKNKKVNKALLALSMLGPGLFLLGYNLGPGSITTMAKAGAEFGMSLFWSLLLSCIFTYILMVAYGQVTLVSGNTALYNIKTQMRYGKPLAIYIIIALILGELLALMGIMGIAVDLIQEAFKILNLNIEVTKTGVTIVYAFLLFALLWFGNYLIFEKVLTVFVIIMIFCFVAVFFLMKPDMKEIFMGLVPDIPSEKGALELIAAMAGTTCSAAVFIIRSIVVSEKGWDKTHLENEKRDSVVSTFMLFFLSGLVMAVAAGTLHVMGYRLSNTIEMIHLFEPIGGRIAAIILVLGVIGAATCTTFPIILITPWLISDYTRQPKSIQSPMYRILGGAGLLIGMSFLFIDRNPPAIMVFSQAFQALILPAVTIPIYVLINKKSLMGNETANRSMNVGIICVFLYGLLTSYFAIAELF
jgi:manganese transport protein